MHICVDFDGTVVDHRFPEIGPEAPGATFWLLTWIAHGAGIVLWTCRAGEHLDQAVAWLEARKVELAGVNQNPEQLAWSCSPKAYGSVYVDDRGFGMPMHQPEGFARPCVDWAQVGPAVLEMLRTGRAA